MNEQIKELTNLASGAKEQFADMTLRDYFAAKAMCGYLTWDTLVNESDTSAEWLEKTAKASYEMADFMLKAREEK